MDWKACGALDRGPEDHCVFEVERIALQQVVPGKPD